MRILSKEEIIFLHSCLIDEFGGEEGLRDEGLLESAISMPFLTSDGVDLYPSVCDKAAHLCVSLICNHAFLDGNKRIGLHAMLVFLSLNGVSLDYGPEEAVNVIMSIAKGEIGTDALRNWLEDHRR